MLSENIFLEQLLPISIQSVSGPHDPIRLNRLHAEAEHFFRLMWVLDDPLKEIGEDPENAPSLQKLDHKLSLLTDLVCLYLQYQHQSPGARLVRIDSRGISWETGEPIAIAVGAALEISLYLYPRIPRPVTLGAECVSLAAGANHWTIQCKFSGFSAELEDLLGKLLFRFHRREVAISRAQKNA